MIDSSAFQGKKAAYYTLGCKLNFSETSTFGKMLEDMGVITAKKGEKADICLINTCSVTEVADHKCRQAIHRMVRNNPGAFVIVTGCYAQLESENVSKIEGVDLVLGANEKAHLIQYLSDAWAQKFAQENGLAAQTPQNGDAESPQNGDAAALHQHYSVKTKEIKTFQPSCSRGNRTRYFLKVQDGCNYYCTYCTIPFARGNPAQCTGATWCCAAAAYRTSCRADSFRPCIYRAKFLQNALLPRCSGLKHQSEHRNKAAGAPESNCSDARRKISAAR